MDTKRSVVDTHIHLWDPDLLRYPWLTTVPDISGFHGPEELKAQEAATDRFKLSQIVFMQAGADDADAIKEARWVNSLAESVEPRITGIIASAPVERGNGVQADLEELATMERVKGIRRLIQGQPEGYASTPEFATGVRMLSRYNFSFDLCIRYHQLNEVTGLVGDCPDIAFILDHIGKPDIAAGALDPWRKDLKMLAQLPNVVCKISGMATEADHSNWQPRDLKPYVDHVIDCFGEDRIVYGGDWPVSLLALKSWGHWVDVLDDLTTHLGSVTQHKLYFENAVRFYCLADQI